MYERAYKVIFLRSIFLVLLFISSLSLADCEKRLNRLSSAPSVKPDSRITSLFKKHFTDHYESGECFENTIRFLENATSLSDTSFYLVSIENRGASTLGMVNAERARGVSFKKKGNGWLEIPDSVEKNWSHHVFAIDSSNNVYDFDYTHKPQIVPLKNYLEKMFLGESDCMNRKDSEICGKREKKLEDYRVTLTRATYALEQKKDPEQKTISLKKFFSGP